MNLEFDAIKEMIEHLEVLQIKILETMEEKIDALHDRLDVIESQIAELQDSKEDDE